MNDVAKDKIIKFGKIYEDNNGDIVVSGFHFEINGLGYSKEIAISLIIERLKEELEIMKEQHQEM